MILSNKQITDLIDKAIKHSTESSKIEFKDARGGLPGSLWKTVSSFSHQPGGGIIVFGIKEDRENGTVEVVGGLELAQLQEGISNFIREGMKNCGPSEIRIIDYRGHQLIALVIQETPDELKPCFSVNLGLPRGACIREGNVDRAITDEEMRSFIRNSAVYKFDKTEASNTDLESISLDKVKSFLQSSAQRVSRNLDNTPTIEVMRNLGIIGNFDRKDALTVAGFLIFSKDVPQRKRKFNRYIIRCVRYQGDSVSSPIMDSQDIDGTLDEQIDNMQKFILRNITKKAEIVGTKRVDRFEYPQEAIRELVANAIIHRDYMITETYTQVNIFSNRLEVSNPGNLPPGITVDNIKDSQFSRNEIIAAILRDLDYLEEYGRGIDIVFSKMHEWGLLEPIFKNTSNVFKVILLGETLNVLNSRQISIWYAIQENKKMTSKACRDLFPDNSKATIANDLKKLAEIGLIIPKGLGMNTFYEPKY